MTETLVKSKQSIIAANEAESWIEFYKKFFGIDIDLDGFLVPAYQPGFRYVVMVPGVGIEDLAKGPKVWFSQFSLTGLKNDRNAEDSPYAILVKTPLADDQQLIDCTALQLSKEGINGITLPEMFIYLLKYGNLGFPTDSKSDSVLCNGSRGSLDAVPVLDYLPKTSLYRVSWAAPDGFIPGSSAKMVIA
jgi:hypothetical protein